MNDSNYMPLLLALGQRVSAHGPGCFHVRILHDDWCAMDYTGSCNCKPVIGEVWIEEEPIPRGSH